MFTNFTLQNNEKKVCTAWLSCDLWDQNGFKQKPFANKEINFDVHSRSLSLNSTFTPEKWWLEDRLWVSITFRGRSPLYLHPHFLKILMIVKAHRRPSIACTSWCTVYFIFQLAQSAEILIFLGRSHHINQGKMHVYQPSTTAFISSLMLPKGSGSAVILGGDIASHHHRQGSRGPDSGWCFRKLGSMVSKWVISPTYLYMAHWG